MKSGIVKKVVYGILAVITVLLFSFCSHTEVSRKQIKDEVSRLEYAYREAVSALNGRDIYRSIEILARSLAVKTSEIETFPEYIELEESCMDLLEEIKSDIQIEVIGDWKYENNLYYTTQSDALEIFTPQFSLHYYDEITRENIKLSNFYYTFLSFDRIDNKKLEDFSGFSLNDGYTDSLVLSKPGRFDETILELFIYIKLDDDINYQIINNPVFFIYPASTFALEIRDGERVKDLSEQLLLNGTIFDNSLLEIASSISFPEYPFVPEPSSNISRFEGLFAPGSYQFNYNNVLPLVYAEYKEEQALENAALIINTLLELSADRFSNLNEVNGVGLYSQIILASIVEKEAASNKNYNEIASVFYNRLKDGMALGSCPTVEYALGYHRPFLTLDDVAINSPYNVYKYPGLPPTPICFFSDEALLAVTEPIETDLYFFVFDWTIGELFFSDTYEEHKENAQIAYQNYINNYGQNSLHDIYYDKFYEK